jgi:hypothetical protein
MGCSSEIMRIKAADQITAWTESSQSRLLPVKRTTVATDEVVTVLKPLACWPFERFLEYNVCPLIQLSFRNTFFGIGKYVQCQPCL